MRKGDLGEVAVRATIDIRYRDDVRACSERLQDIGSRSRAGAEGKSIAGMLERCDCAFEVVAAGVLACGALYSGAAGRVPIGVRRARVLVLAHRLANGRLRVGCGKRDLALSASAVLEACVHCTHSLNHSASNGIVRASSVYCKGAEPVHWAGRARRGIDGVFGERHDDVLHFCQ